MARRSTNFSLAVKTEGGMFPTDFLLDLAALGKEIEGLKPEQYHLSDREKINEAINQAYSRLQGFWLSFKDAFEKLPLDDYATSATREKWLLPLFDCLGYGRLTAAEAVTVGDRQYKPSHMRESVAIHLVGFRVDLDKRSTAGGARSSSPHSLVQELLNQSDNHLWAFVSNGRKLRVLRDNVSLTRQAFIEFDIENIFEGDGYADFRLLWLLCHQSRVEGTPPNSCWLEKWKDAAQQTGVRARDDLRKGVEQALEIFGTGFLKHRDNEHLRTAIKSGKIGGEEYYRQLLRLIYRLLFLFVTEDRDLLILPAATSTQRKNYYEYYSTGRLRKISGKRKGTLHNDLWSNLLFVFEKLGTDKGCPELGLPALGSNLWSADAIPALDTCKLYNLDLLASMNSLCFIQENGFRRSVNYDQLESEELGSIYESLLDQIPFIEVSESLPKFTLSQTAGSERKTTGSYYTPNNLVTCLLDSALDPVLQEAVKSKNPERAILALTVCDPACGSGHFLIAAAHRIAKKLAALRSGDIEPPPKFTKIALRDVISKCLYGVDFNEMAVELCKLSLWLQAAIPGVPLSFLDHKIKAGNSLFGTTPALIEQGIPDAAFDTLEGDEKDYAKSVRAANKQQTDGCCLPGLLNYQNEALANAGVELASMDLLPDSNITTVHEKEKRYADIQNSRNYVHDKFVCDSWCAAFVWNLNKGAPSPITREVFGRIRADHNTASPETHKEVARLKNLYRFFHWHIEFPQLFVSQANDSATREKRHGFDVILGNPPWEKVKLQQREWFASRSLDIAEGQTAAIRKKSITSLDDSNPLLQKEFREAKRLSEAEALFYRKSKKFELGACGDTNTYPLFLELSLQLLNSSGRCGMIVKTGILADYTMRDFFSNLIVTQRLVSAFDFSNKRLIFPAVVANERFTLLTVCGTDGWRQEISISILNEKVEDLSATGNTWSIKPTEVALVNPNTLTCPLFQNQKEAAIALEVYKRLPVLINEKRPELSSGYGCEYVRMFDMTNDSDLFRDQEQLSSDNTETPSPRWTSHGIVYVSLFEGKLFEQNDHRFGTFSGIERTKRFGIKAEPNHPSDIDKRNPEYKTIPRYWIPETELLEKLAQYDNPPGLLAFRDVCRTHTDSRTVRACILPPLAAGNKAPVFTFPGLCNEDASQRSLLLCSNLSSFILDFIARQKFSGGSLNRYVIIQLPVVPLAAFEETCPWDHTKNLSAWVSERAIELAYTSYELSKFAEAAGFKREPFLWDQERRFELKCELDAAYFILYGLNSDEAAFVFDSFRIVKERELELFGDYRSKTRTLALIEQFMMLGKIDKVRLV